MKIEITKNEVKALLDALLLTKDFRKKRENSYRELAYKLKGTGTEEHHTATVEAERLEDLNRSLSVIESKFCEVVYGPVEKVPIRAGEFTELEMVDYLLDHGIEDKAFEEQEEVIARALLAYKGALYLSDAVLLSKCDVKSSTH